MTNGEALEILNRDDKKMRRGFFCINDFIAIEKCKEVLATAPQWIPVSERLPQEDDSCLVTRTDGKYTWVEEGEWVIDEFLFAEDEYRVGFKQRIENVAWMPLPKPYEGDDDND